YTYSRFTLKQNHSQGKYNDTNADRSQMHRGKFSQRGLVHNPSIQVAVNEQIRLIFEMPFWMRDPAPGNPRVDAERTSTTVSGEKEVIEQQFIATLHGKF